MIQDEQNPYDLVINIRVLQKCVYVLDVFSVSLHWALLLQEISSALK